MEELKELLQNNLESIWDKAYGEDVKERTMYTVADMYDELDGFWFNNFGDSVFWEAGYKAICEALGDAYFRFDTDCPEQNPVIHYLIKLVEANPGDKCVKKLLENIKLEKIKKDFE